MILVEISVVLIGTGILPVSSHTQKIIPQGHHSQKGLEKCSLIVCFISLHWLLYSKMSNKSYMKKDISKIMHLIL